MLSCNSIYFITYEQNQKILNFILRISQTDKVCFEKTHQTAEILANVKFLKHMTKYSRHFEGHRPKIFISILNKDIKN